MPIPSMKDMRAIAVALGGARQILTSHQGAIVVVDGQARTFDATGQISDIDRALQLIGAAPAAISSSPITYRSP